MSRKERARYEMLLRVREFGEAHPELFPKTSTGAEAFANVAQAAGEIEDHVINKEFAAKHGREAMAMARRRVAERMRTVARTARGLQKPRGTTAEWLRMPGKTSDVALIAIARGFLQQAEPCKTELARLALPDPCLAELREAVDALEAALAERRSARLDASDAQEGIRRAMVLGASAIRTLDIVVANTLEGNAALFAAWKVIRRVAYRRRRAASDAAAEPETPATTEHVIGNT